MECSKRAKVKISLSGSGESMCTCYRHGFMYVKVHMQRLDDFDFGIYIQRAPNKVRKYEPVEFVDQNKEQTPKVEESVVQDKEWDF